MASEAKQRARRGRTRMTSAQRREQLIEVARGLFAEKGIDGTSVEEIAARAEVSKPVVYEHFGGKEGLYAVVVDREVCALGSAIHEALHSSTSYRGLIEAGTMALLDYIDACPDGFRIISRDSSVASSGTGTFASILSDITDSVANILVDPLTKRGYHPVLGMAFAQGLVGLVASAGQFWLDNRALPKAELAAQLVNLVWNGLANLELSPTLGVSQAKSCEAMPPAD